MQYFCLKMYILKLALTAAFVLGTFAEIEEDDKKSNASFCGQEEPDYEKTCISLKLPWQEEPVYFCTDKGRISYKDRCGNEVNRWCYGQDRENTLQIATPWDCCPITSIPDYCAGRSCPAAPFNRTCEEIQPDKKDPWDCCSTYYCDQDVKPGDCHMKRLTPGCMKAPKDKKTCVGFKDNNGCCNKYQCEGDGKPGMCPMEAQALKFKLVMENSNKTKNPHTSALSKNLDFHRRRYIFSRWVGSGSTTYMRCTGDHTCPGSMKCCSGDIEMYHGVRSILSKSSSNSERAAYGYCQDPVEFASTDDSTSSSLLGSVTESANMIEDGTDV